MEYAKDEVFSIRYKGKKDKLECPFHMKVLRKIKNNKFMTLLITMGVLFSIINFTLIYCFFDILNRI